MGSASDQSPTPNRPAFPTTRWSMVAAAGRREDPGLRSLVAAYDRPIRAYLAARWRLAPDEVGDRAQDFFLELLQRDVLSLADPARARFRTFVRAVLDSAVVDEFRRGMAQKRGGDRERVPLDAVSDAPRHAESPEQVLDREWRRSLVERALSELERELAEIDQQTRFAVFRSWYLDDGESVDHVMLAERHDIPRHTVSNHLRLAKQRFRAILERLLRDTVRDADDLEAELAWFFGGST